MQNTSNIPNIPNTLINNFFIAGVNQQTLSTRILENKAYKIPPEVLFTMYEGKERVSDYLQFVFPEKVAVEYNAQDPKFYSFLTTDSAGYNQYIHVLIFYEEINEAEISANDFDNMAEMLRKQHLNRQKTNRNKSLTKNKNMREGSTGQIDKLDGQDGTLLHQNRERVQKMFALRKMTCKKLCAQELKHLRGSYDTENKDDEGNPSTPKRNNLDRLFQESRRRAEERKRHEIEAKEKMERMMLNIQYHGNQQAITPIEAQSLNQSQNTIARQVAQIDPKPIYQNIKGQTGPLSRKTGITQGNQFGQSVSYVIKKPSNDLIKQPTMKRDKSSNQDVTKNGSGTPKLGNDQTLLLDESVTFTGAAKIAQARPTVDPKHKFAFDDTYRSNRRFGQTDVGGITHQEEPVLPSSQNQNILDEIEFDLGYDAPVLGYKQPSAFPDSGEHYSEDDQLQRLYENKRYVPVALCLSTETEYHDIFRQILLALFDMIRIPENLINNKIFENRTLAFAELISHLAFFKSIPAPTFNSTYNIHCLNQVFTFKEQSYDQIPNRNQYAIRILFDVLDVKSIFYCFKALLFDKSLVLVSSQYSLQFYVAEALRQLLFPMTWQNSYIQPGNENLAGYCDGTIVCIYGSNSMVNGFDFFDGLQHPNIVICDIDAGYTNNISQFNSQDLPTLPDEPMYIRILNMLKNSRINQYDKAYPDSHIPDTDDFVQQVRETFFGMLKPFLSRIEDYIDKSIAVKDATFDKYFKLMDYLDHFECYGKQHHEFAKALVVSSQFVHFCDDYFAEVDHNNFKMLKEIFRSRGETIQMTDEAKFKQNIRSKTTMFDFLKEDANCKTGRCNWPDSEPVVFNIRMPQDNQRIMLFEKILFMNEKSMLKREQDVTRKTNQHIIENKDNLLFERYISDIKKLYPIKLRKIHKRYQAQDMKINLMSKNKNVTQMSAIEVASQRQQLSKIPYQVKAPQFSAAPAKVRAMPRKKVSTDTVNIIELDIGRSSFVEQRLSKKLNQSNLLNNLQQTPTTQKPQEGTQEILNRQINKNLVMNLNQPQIMLPMDMVNSQDELNYTSSFLGQPSNANNSLFEQEQQRIWQCRKRISRLMYGRQGLIAFLGHLFGLLKEKQMKRVNYYFSLKNQIQNMTDHARNLSVHLKEKRQNNPIQEEYEEEKSPVNSQRNTNQYQDNMMGPSRTPVSQQSESQVKIKIFSKQSSTVNNIATSSNSSNRFKSEKEWIFIDQWDTQACILKDSYQFILFQIKLYEAFECPEDSYSLIWKSLLKFPTNKMKFFPVSKFQLIWDSLTQTQQQEQFTKLCQKTDRPCIQLLSKAYVKQRMTMNRSTSADTFSSPSNQGTFTSVFKGTFKSDESIFSGATITKTFAQKKQEKKDRESQLQNSKSCKIIDVTPLSGSVCSGSTKEILSKKEEKIKKQLDSNQKSINEKLKKNIILSKFNSASPALDQVKGQPPPLSTKSKTSDHFNFRGSQQEPMTPKLEKQSTSNDSYKTFATSKKSSSTTIDFEMRKNINASKLQIKPLNEPALYSQNLLKKINRFWKKNSIFVQKSGNFLVTQLERLQEDLTDIDKKLHKLKHYEPIFNDSNSDIEKQVFFLNLFNFVVLYHLAVQMISNQESVTKLKDYNMWQAFLMQSYAKISLHTFNAFTIMHSILRPKLQLPEISQFVLNTPPLEQNCSRFQVKKPHPLIAFGFYLPLKKFPALRIYTVQDFDNELRQGTMMYIRDRMSVKNGCFYMHLPKILAWYRKDFQGQTNEDLLRFINEEVFKGKQQQLTVILENLKSNTGNIKDYIVEFGCFDWDFKPLKMTQFFPDERLTILMKDYQVIKQKQNTLRGPLTAFKTSVVTTICLYLVTLMLAVKMLISLKTYMALFYTSAFVLMSIISIAMTFFIYQQATLTAPLTKPRHLLLSKLWYGAVVIAFAFMTLTMFYSNQMESLIGIIQEESNLPLMQDKRSSLVGVGVGAGLSTMFGFVFVGVYGFYLKSMKRQHDLIEKSKSSIHEMELYADAVQHLYEELQLEKSQPQPPKRQL